MCVVMTQESLTKLAILPARHSAVHLKCLPFVLSGCPAHFRQHVPPSPSVLLGSCAALFLKWAFKGLCGIEFYFQRSV